MKTYDKLLEDIYASQYKINKIQVQNPKTGEWEWHDRKVRTKRIEFKNSKMGGKPAQEKDMKTENMVEASKTRNATTDFLRKHPVSDSEMVKKVSSCKRCEGRGKVWKSSRDGPVLPGNNQDIDTKRYTCGACKGVGVVKEEIEQGVAEASNTMQRYGQLIIKRARQAKREAEAAEKAKRDAEQKEAEKKPVKEQSEQIDEAPLRAVSALVGYPKLNKKIAAKGTPGSEDERNKAAAGLKRDRSGLGRRAYTGDQHYDVRREELELDEEGVAEESTPYWKKSSFIKKMSQMAKQERREREQKEAEKKPVKEQYEQIDEVLDPSMGAGEYIKDFQKSDAPQFKGKSKEKKRMMGIAAYLQAKRDVKEEVELEEGYYSDQDVQSQDKRIASAKAKKAMTPPFSGPYTKSPATTKDKSGAVHTPMSRAKHLARMAMQQKMKEEFGVDIDDVMADSLVETVLDEGIWTEALIGGQKKLDKNRNGKLDAEDFKKLRKEAKDEEEYEQIGDLNREEVNFDDDGTLVAEKVSYSDFLRNLQEIKLADLPRRNIKGNSYGADYEDPEGMEDEDKPKRTAPVPTVKRGRGRPAGSKSGANQKVSSGGKRSGIKYSTHHLHLPNSNR